MSLSELLTLQDHSAFKEWKEHLEAGQDEVYQEYTKYAHDKNIIQKDTDTPMSIAALFTITKPQKQSKHPEIYESIKKFWHTQTHAHMCVYICVFFFVCVCTHNRILFSSKIMKKSCHS